MPVPAPEAAPLSEQDARRIQDELRGRVVRADRLGPVRRVAAVDAHYSANQEVTWAAVALVGANDLELRESVLACRPTSFPYIPGFLSFREAPVMLDALACLSVRPDLLLVDGQGIAHPRRFGLACHVGVLADLPTIGVAKSLLAGRYLEPGPERGDWTPLIHRGEVVGAALRTRKGTRPVFVSVGHRVALETAIDHVMRCTPRFRLSEPIRLADRLSRMHGNEWGDEGSGGTENL